MPLPRWLARFNRVGTNRLFGLFAPRLAPWAVVRHWGRTTGREYATVVWMFRTTDGFVAALTYGAQSEWVRNVLAADACVVERRGQEIGVVRPRVITGAEGRKLMPRPLRPVLRVLRVSEYLVMPTA